MEARKKRAYDLHSSPIQALLILNLAEPVGFSKHPCPTAWIYSRTFGQGIPIGGEMQAYSYPFIPQYAALRRGVKTAS